MDTLELNLSEQNILDFEVDIQGVTSETVNAQFIIEGDGMKYAFDGTLTEGAVSVEIPIMANILKPQQYKAKMAFIVEGKYFEPMEVMVDFIKPISISTTVKESTVKKSAKKVEESASEVKISSVRVSNTKSVMERMEEALPKLAQAHNKDELVSIYNSDVLLKENADTSVRDALDFINAYTKDKYKMDFKQYIKENKS